MAIDCASPQMRTRESGYSRAQEGLLMQNPAVQFHPFHKKGLPPVDEGRVRESLDFIWGFTRDHFDTYGPVSKVSNQKCS